MGVGKVIPEYVCNLLGSLNQCLMRGDLPSEALIEANVAAFDTLSPDDIVLADIYIRKFLYRCSEIVHFENERGQTLDLLRRMPALAQVLTFHRDGYVREAALKVLTIVPRSPFMLAALIIRLNDWVEPVRVAAIKCVQPLCAQVDPDVAVAAGMSLCGRWHEWTRWTSAQALCMDHLFARPAVNERLAIRFVSQLDGPLATTLRYFLCAPVLDTALPMLAAQARQASVRAVALEVLLCGQAKWKKGRRREWINKIYNISRSIPVIESRAISVPVIRNDLISMGLCDRSSIVRRVILMALTKNWQDFPDLDSVMPALLQDRSPTVRRWAGYLVRQRAALPH